MSQLHKKSFVASATGHFLLLALLFVGPAFFMAKYEPTGSSKTGPIETTITVLPNGRVEETLSKSDRPNPTSTSSPQSSKQTPTQPSLRPVHRLPHADISQPLFRHSAENKAPIPEGGTSELSASRQKQVDNMLESIRKQLAPGNKSGPINSVRSNVDYGQFVEAVYDNAWLAPDSLADPDATVKVAVTVSRNGEVVSSKILNRSGVSTLDKSIEGALDRVKTIGRPFPDSEKEEQRTFIINFNLRAKRIL